MTYPLVQFVSAPEVGATVRFDFNASLGVGVESFPEHEGFSLGAPEMIGNPGEYGTTWGDRELTLTAFIEGSRSAAFAAQTSLARELWRRENWLLFQLDASSPPRWFKTYRSGPGAASFDNVYLDREPDLWGIPITLTAEAFAYGPRETVGPVTITNNPSSGTNRMSYVLPTIKGDVPAPLRVRASVSANRSAVKTLLNVSPVATTANHLAQVGTGDSWVTIGTDVGAPVANSALSGGSYRAVSFASGDAEADRLTGKFPAGMKPGRYRTLVRVARSDTSSTFSLRLKRSVPTANVWTGEAVSFAPPSGGSAGWAAWVDLGDTSIPFGMLDEATLSSLSFDSTLGSYTIAAARTSGTGALWLDAVMFLPVDISEVGEPGRTMTSDFGVVGGALYGPDMYNTWDAETEAFYAEYTSASAWAGTYPDLIPPLPGGEFPIAHPGMSNKLHLFTLPSASTTTLGTSDSITWTTTVEIAYRPRYLYIGEA